MTASIHRTARAHHQKHAEAMTKRAGYAGGGAVDEGDKEAVHKHERHLHRGKPITKLKKGGKTPGKKAAHRLDKRSRHADGGEVEERPLREVKAAATKPAPDVKPAPLKPPHAMAGGGEVYKASPRTETRRDKQENINVDSERPARARGGRMPHGRGKTNIIIHAGGASDPAEKQQALQQGMKMGAMMGAKAAAAKMGGGAPPMGGAPPGGMPGAPPGPMGAPPGGPPMPMHAKGGQVRDKDPKPKDQSEHVKVKAHVRRARGGKTC